MKQMMVLVTTGLLVAACGGDKNAAEGNSITIGEGGETASVRVGGSEDNGIAPPANLPDFAPIYPGATIQSAITGNEGEAKGMVTMLTDAKMADIIAFYRDKGKAAGMTVSSEAAMGEARMLTMNRSGAGEDPGLQISVAPMDDVGKSLISLIYDGGKPA